MSEGNIDTKTKIVSVAQTLFAQNGFMQTTVAQIAKLTGVGKGTIYLYFDNKDEILQAVILEGSQCFVRTISQISLPEDDYFAGLESLIGGYLQYCQNYQEFFRIITREYRWFDQNAMVSSFVNSYNGFLVAYLRIGVDVGLLRPGDPNYFVWALSGLIMQCSLGFHEAKPQVSAKELTLEICQLFLNGSRTVLQEN